jgi:hypothetical protein
LDVQGFLTLPGWNPSRAYFCRHLLEPRAKASALISAVQFSTDGMQVNLKFTGETLVDVTPVSFKEI